MLMLRSVFVVWAAMAGCRPPVLRLSPGLVPQPSPDLPPGQVVGEVVDSASRSAIVYAKVVLLSAMIVLICGGWLVAGRSIAPLLRDRRRARVVNVALATALVVATALAIRH